MNYQRLTVPVPIDAAAYRSLSDAWSRATDGELVLPSFSGQEEVLRFVEQLAVFLPDHFAYLILSELAERDELESPVLNRLFDLGDTSTRISICLRSDLSPDLLARCLASEEPGVAEHVAFNPLVSLEQGRELLVRFASSPVSSAIQRALEVKRNASTSR